MIPVITKPMFPAEEERDDKYLTVPLISTLYLADYIKKNWFLQHKCKGNSSKAKYNVLALYCCEDTEQLQSLFYGIKWKDQLFIKYSRLRIHILRKPVTRNLTTDIYILILRFALKTSIQAQFSELFHIIAHLKRFLNSQKRLNIYHKFLTCEICTTLYFSIIQLNPRSHFIWQSSIKKIWSKSLQNYLVLF